MKRVLFFFLLILSIHFINAQPLSQRLDALLHEEVLKTSEVGIAVFDLTTGKSVYRYQDDKLYRNLSSSLHQKNSECNNNQQNNKLNQEHYQTTSLVRHTGNQFLE